MAVGTILTTTLPVCAAQPSPNWEQTTAISIDNADGDRFDVRTRDGYIVVTTDHQVTIKLFSILGQLISQQTLQPGVWRLKVKARGIYILKTDTVTRRVTV